MAFATHQIKQYIVEFIRGTGIRTNGVVNASNTGTITPFTWIVPHDVVQLTLDGCSGGSGGGAGGKSDGIWQSGGGGGASGMQCHDILVAARPLSTLTITIGAGGLGGIAGSGVGFGGDTIQAGATWVSGLLPGVGNSSGTFYLSPASVISSTNGAGNSSTTTSVAGGVGGTTGVGLGTSPAGGSSAAGGGITGQPGSIDFSIGFIRGHSGGGGGGSATLNTSAGGQGGAGHQGNTVDYGLAGDFSVNGGTGNVLGGVVSRAGGGGGASGLFGRGGLGGNGGVNGTNSTGYGSGGGGGGGGANGGNGADGYLRITFWSYE